MDYEVTTRSGRCIKYNQSYVEKYIFKKNQTELINKIKKILSKNGTDRSEDELKILNDNQDLLKKLEDSRKARMQTLLHSEIELDPDSAIAMKCVQLADIIKNSKYCIVYTGAGISTSASIPDYRGPNGLWTMQKKGVHIETPDFARVQPTYSHYVLKKLLDLNIIKYIVSQNCDGLHLRSGIPRNKLSELHGNCFIEQCKTCNKEYARLFDVTENTKFRKHYTGRYCLICKNELTDTIIHFGEKLRDGLPYNLDEAHEIVRNADCILCLGTSMKVLKHYTWLWPRKLSPIQLCIVNIQWTPKDKYAKLKVNGYTDVILSELCKHLNVGDIDEYKCEYDPLMSLACKLNDDELKSTTKSMIDSDSLVGISNTNSWYTKSFKK